MFLGFGAVPIPVQHLVHIGAVSEPVTATHGMPPGCGHAADLLHAFLLGTLQSAGRHVSVRKYVDDMVFVAPGPCFAGHLCYGYRQVHKSFTKANMKVNLKKTVVICNGATAKRLLMKVWRAGRLPPPKMTTWNQRPGSRHSVGGLEMSGTEKESHHLSTIHESRAVAWITSYQQSEDCEISL
eukprot:6482569-Amphidinium_carterae.1